MKLRLATLSDLPVVTKLLRAFLAEQDGRTPVQFTRRTLDAYLDWFRQYLEGGLAGVVVLAEDEDGPAGMAVGGAGVGPCLLDLNLGRVALVSVVWVVPSQRKHGLALQMLSFGQPHLVEMGFVTATMTAWEDNAEGHALCRAFGASPAERTYHFPLQEADRGQ